MRDVVVERRLVGNDVVDLDFAKGEPRRRDPDADTHGADDRRRACCASQGWFPGRVQHLDPVPAAQMKVSTREVSAG